MTLLAQVLHLILVVAGVTVLLLGLVKLAFVPLAIGFEGSERRRRRRNRQRRLLEARLSFTPDATVLGVSDTWWDLDSLRRQAARQRTVLDHAPFVSVIVPCYNEEAVLAHCVRSILRSDYPAYEIILVDDGSRDRTAQIAYELAAEATNVTVLRQANAGKGAALNAGIRTARGEMFMFVDADGIFAADTITRMLDGFTDDEVGAVCGDDRPVNLDRLQTRLLALISHVGTGLVRRVLTVLGCLPIVSGNIGAFPRSIMEEVGPFREDTIGEDLELTWRVHRSGHQVRFQPEALVRAESPSTVRDLWRQRVRWSRGFLQTLRLHRDVVGNPRYGAFGVYTAYNVLSMVVVPCLQILILLVLPLTWVVGQDPVTLSVVGLVAASGMTVSLTLLIMSVALNRAWGDLRFLPVVVLWPLYSIFTALTMVWALHQEARGVAARWNKVARTGVVSQAALP